MAEAGPAVAGSDGERVRSGATLTCRPHMSGPFLGKGPQTGLATEETQVRAPSQGTAQQTHAGQPLKPEEQQSTAPVPTRIGTVDVEQFSRNLARLVEEGGRALAAYLRPREEGRDDKELADEVTEVV